MIVTRSQRLAESHGHPRTQTLNRNGAIRLRSDVQRRAMAENRQKTMIIKGAEIRCARGSDRLCHQKAWLGAFEASDDLIPKKTGLGTISHLVFL